MQMKSITNRFPFFYHLSAVISLSGNCAKFMYLITILSCSFYFPFRTIIIFLGFLEVNIFLLYQSVPKNTYSRRVTRDVLQTYGHKVQADRLKGRTFNNEDKITGKLESNYKRIILFYNIVRLVSVTIKP